MSVSPTVGPRGIFISYRRDDVPEGARMLRDKLGEQFPGAVIYFDVDEEPGIDWQARIRDRGRDADVFLAVIGPRWVSELKVRTEATRSNGQVDFVRREIEWALIEWPGVVIPVLINTAMPDERDLPRSIKGLCRKQAEMLRHATTPEDVERLVRRLGAIGSTVEPARAAETSQSEQFAPLPAPRRAAGVPAPTEEHYDEVAEEVIKGSVVLWLGASVRGALPDARFLAGKLAGAFPDLGLQSPDLAETAQSIAMMKGKKQLQGQLHELIEQHSEPISAHRLLAAIPGLMRRHGLPERHQLIISTNYDRALEQAFEDVNEPFDYAVYMPKAGRFVHFPWGESDDEPRAVTINDPADYFDFPIAVDSYELELARTVIVKLHGAPNFWEAKRQWPDDYVVTEDQYIDYLPTLNIEEHLPVQVLNKLIGSPCLFLGYTLREWSSRVLLRRLWQGMEIGENWWVIESDPDDLEKRLWGAIPRTELLDAHPTEYIDKLVATLKSGFGATPATEPVV